MPQGLSSGQIQTALFVGAAVLCVALAVILPSSSPKYLSGVLRSCEAINIGHRGGTVSYDCSVQLSSGNVVLAHAQSRFDPGSTVQIEELFLGRTKTYRLIERR